MFPNGWPGRALLLLRLAAAAILIRDGVANLVGQSRWDLIALQSVAIAAGLFLLVGLWTPVVGVIVAILGVWAVISGTALRPRRHTPCCGRSGARHARPRRHFHRCSSFWKKAYRHPLVLGPGRVVPVSPESGIPACSNLVLKPQPHRGLFLNFTAVRIASKFTEGGSQ